MNFCNMWNPHGERPQGYIDSLLDSMPKGSNVFPCKRRRCPVMSREKFLSAPSLCFVWGCARLCQRLAVRGFPPPYSQEWESVLSEDLRVSESGRSPRACDGKSTFLLCGAPLGRLLHMLSVHPTANSTTRGLLAIDLVILNRGQVTRTIPELAPSLLIYISHQRGGRGSRVVWASDRGWLCHEFEPSTTKDPQCRAAMHAKTVEI
ncbi:hypothetical protein TNCV_4567821 [Trichonephila clavipes]|nr:hypothetical protein TNCV_4567821 [Trichonephila clavipes]